MGSPEQKAQLYLQHPDESPEMVGFLPYLIHPASKLSSTAAWLSFRDKTLLPMMRRRPDDPNLANFLKQVEAVLAWRANSGEVFGASIDAKAYSIGPVIQYTGAQIGYNPQDRFMVPVSPIQVIHQSW